MLSHKKPLIATVAILVLIFFTIFSLTTFTTAYASLVVAVLQAIDDSESEYEDPEEMEDNTGTGQSAIDGIVFYDKWHRMCEELDWEKVENYLNTENPTLSGAGSPAGVSEWDYNYLAVIKLYSLVCEILTRQEINPGLTSDPYGEGQHAECDLCLNPLWVLGKIATESGIDIDPRVWTGVASRQDDTDDILLTEGSHVKDPIAGGWFSQNYVELIPWAMDTFHPSDPNSAKGTMYEYLQNLHFLTNKNISDTVTYTDINGKTYTGLEAIEQWFTTGIQVVDDQFKSTYAIASTSTFGFMANELFNGPGNNECTGPVGQNLWFSYNWNNGYTSHASIFISRQENPSLEEEKRAIYGLRGAIYKGAGKYLTGDIWSNGGLSTAPLETAPQEEIASNIRQGYLDPNDPLCYQSRPAIYYYPDALYSLCLSLRTTYERDKDKDYLSRFSSLTGETKSNVYIMILAGTQAGTQAGTDGAVNMSNWLAAQTSYDINTLFTVATRTDDYRCGIRNLHNGVGHIEAFHYIIEQLYSREDLRRTTLVESGAIDIVETPEWGGFLWPVDTKFNKISSIFGAKAGEFAYVSKNHDGIDIVGDKIGIGDADIHPIAPGRVYAVSNTCGHNYGKNSSCGCGGGFGNYVWVYHGNGIYSLYAHMVPDSNTNIKVGQFVTQDTVLGKVGTTGWSTGNHLHLAIGYKGISNSAKYRREPLAFRYENMPLSEMTGGNAGITKYLHAFLDKGVLDYCNSADKNCGQAPTLSTEIIEEVRKECTS